VLQRVAARCSVLQCDAVGFVVLQCVAAHPDSIASGAMVHADMRVLQCVAACCNELQPCVAVCCSIALKCVAMCCSVLQRTPTALPVALSPTLVRVYYSVLQCVVVCCSSVLQRVAACCSVL